MAFTNPYLPENVFIPDGEPHVFGDRVYVYGSHDLYGQKDLCQGDYECWSAPLDDLTAWKNEGVIYRRMQDPYIQNVVKAGTGSMFNQYLYAPDVVKVNEHWYLYYGVAMAGSGIGVAVADQPTGPFEYLGRVRLPKSEQPVGWVDDQDGINDGDMALGNGQPMVTFDPKTHQPEFHFENYVYDPALLYDQGRLFLYFGCGHCYVAELSTDDMRTLVAAPELNGQYVSNDLLPSAADPAVQTKQHGWHMGNGASIRKIDGTYFLSYYAAHDDDGNAMCYSTAKTPFGPFEYQGVLVSLGNGWVNDQQRPTAYAGNTHGGMFNANGHWYQNYHRHTGDPFDARQACLVELTRDENGMFKTAEFKSQIYSQGGLPWNEEYRANTACVLVDRNGQTKAQSDSPYLTMQNDQQVATNLTDGSMLGFKYLDFTKAPAKQTLTVKMAKPGNGQVKVMIDHQQAVGVIKTDAKQTTFKAPTHVPAGIHEVDLIFEGQTNQSQLISWQFA